MDTSAGRLTGYLPDLSEAESNAYRDFFFANQEPFRFVVQRDTDQPLMPKADGLVLLPMAIRWPAALCSTRPRPQEP